MGSMIFVTIKKSLGAFQIDITKRNIIINKRIVRMKQIYVIDMCFASELMLLVQSKKRSLCVFVVLGLSTFVNSTLRKDRYLMSCG